MNREINAHHMQRKTEARNMDRKTEAQKSAKNRSGTFVPDSPGTF